MRPVKITVGEIELECEMGGTETANKLLAAMPLEGSAAYWGAELYFRTPVDADTEPNASDVVPPGTIAYWPPGRCLCVFWGPTPASEGDECRAADAVNVVGRVLNPEALQGLRGRAVRVEAAN